MKCARCGNELPDSTPLPIYWPCKVGAGLLCDFGDKTGFGTVGELSEEAKMIIAAEPSAVRQAWTYANAVGKWKAAGSPVRSQAEIDGNLAICKVCPMFIDDGKRPRCRLCGCSLNKAPDGLNNKIAMATEGCPASPPKWAAVVNDSPAPATQTAETGLPG